MAAARELEEQQRAASLAQERAELARQAAELAASQNEAGQAEVDAGKAALAAQEQAAQLAQEKARQAEQLLHIKKQMAELIAEHTGQSIEQIEADSDRDRWFSATEAKEYGFVDHVFERSTDRTDATDDVDADDVRK